MKVAGNIFETMRSMRPFWLAACAVGCLTHPTGVEAPVVTVSPDGPVAPTEAVVLAWPAGFALSRPPEASAAGRSIPAALDPRTEGAVLTPLPRWPEATEVQVDLRLEGRAGRADLAVRFPVKTGAPAPPPPVVVRRPVPGQLAPSNLAWLAVAGTDAPEIALDGPGGPVRADRFEPSLYRIDDSGPCSGVCPGARYRLAEAELGPTGEVSTATTPDTTPPRIERLALFATPGRLEVEVAADEVVRAAGRWSSEPSSGALAAIGTPGPSIRLEARPAPPDGAAVEVVLDVYDLADLGTSTRSRVRTPEVPRVAITEVVTTPRSDWNDSEPNGEPFDAFPGTGAVTSADEWIELVNRGGRALDADAAGLEVHALDATPTVTRVATAAGFRFGDGGTMSSWAPGEALVLRPRGSMAQQVTVEVWAGAVLLDRVVVGRSAGADHPGGAPPDRDHESLARAQDGMWRWCIPTPGDPTPNPVCRRD